MAQDRNCLEILDRNACRDLLVTEVLGRIGLTVNALPVVLPVNYQLFDGQLIIPAQGEFVEVSLTEKGLYPIVTHKFANVGKGALGLFQAGDAAATGAAAH